MTPKEKIEFRMKLGVALSPQELGMVLSDVNSRIKELEEKLEEHISRYRQESDRNAREALQPTTIRPKSK